MVNSGHGRPDVVRSLLLLPQRNLPLLLVSWTLVYEMFFYLLFAGALRWLREDDLSRVPMAWAVVVIAGHALLRPGEDQPVLNLLFSPLLLEFILGCLVAQHVAGIGRRAAIGSLIMGVAGFAAGTLALAARGEPFPPGWTRVLIYGSSSALVVAALIALERTSRHRVPRPLVALGDASYSLYLSHVPVIAVVGLVWRRLAAEPPPGLHVAALVSGFAVALAAGVASFHLIEMPLLRASRRLATCRHGRADPLGFTPAACRRSPMSEACIVGWAHSPFGKLDDPDVEALIGRVARAAIDDAGIAPADVEAGFVSLFNNGFSAQDFPASLVLQHVPELRFRPITRYENACASGSAAVHGARDFLAAGRGRFALVIGVEKMTATPGAQVGDILLKASYQKEEADIPAGFAGVFGRIAERYFQRYGDQSDALAAIAAKNHRNGVDNPYAQMRKDLGYDFCRHVSEKNPYVAPPLKRTDCSLVSDGAAALVMTDEETARSMGKAVRFRAAVQVNDFLPISRRDVTRFEGAAEAWRRALDVADVRLDELSFVELHDCFTIAELLEYEAMGLTAPGQGARAVLEGWTAKDGRLPVNPSGGLKAKGHPIGATGVSMHAITAMQLTGQAGAMQLPKADIAGVFNMGGAAVANYVSILEAMR